MIGNHDTCQRSAFDSGQDRRWSVLLRHHTQRGTIEELILPAVDEKVIGRALGGPREVAAHEGLSPVSASHVPVVVSLMGSDRLLQLRWWSLPHHPLGRLRLHFQAGPPSRIVCELWDRQSGRDSFPESPKFNDVVLQHMITGVFGTAKRGIPDIYAESAARFIITHLLVTYGQRPRVPIHPPEDTRALQAQSYLRENLHLPFSLSALAEHVHLSRYHFLRIFKAQTGETPHRYLTRLRMEEARRELKNSKGSIDEISARCGFTSAAHFSRTFRRETGCSPSAYRNLPG
ncbi:helix-turn-helix domain-containing protein [Streptomyces sp. NPDC087658]|uniref:helix-turn-helix domain-containing protein n=1 Tax=Streptomyces sp. NPDC087658 TaxID=3365800 RepID=UPI003813C899